MSWTEEKVAKLKELWGRGRKKTMGIEWKREAAKGPDTMRTEWISQNSRIFLKSCGR